MRVCVCVCVCVCVHVCVSGEGVSGEEVHTLVPAVANWMVECAVMGAVT